MRESRQSMEQALRLGLAQHLVMTTQLQQAIQILQLSASDLRATVEQAYLENPTLEIVEPQSELTDGSLWRAENLPALTSYLDGAGAFDNGVYASEEHGGEPAATANLTLEEELLAQARLALRDQQELAIAAFIIGSLDNRGYLTVSLAEVARAVQVTSAMAQRVLQIVQGFEPAGVAARDLPECLRLQAERQGVYRGLLAAIIEQHLSDVAAGDLKAIARARHCTMAAVQATVDQLRRFDPKPGRAYGRTEAVALEPDVLVRKVQGTYQVQLNDNGVPQLKIAAAYRHALAGDTATQKYITDRLRAAEWLIKSIAQRRETIRRVVEEIVRRQQAFLEYGAGHLQAMTMQEVAAAIGVHESTVSRAVANKYVALPRGIMPLRQFFTASLAQAGADAFIAPQVKAALEQLIAGEDKHHPLSDQKLCNLLAAQGMKLARRTVMKYREQLGVPSSTKRKRY